MSISKAHEKALTDRGISRETIQAMQIYSGSFADDGSVQDDPKGTILCFPFIENGEEINTKYRWKDKDGNRRFMQRKDAVKTFFNAYVLLDERNMIALETGTDALVITEGEIDCMTCIEAGYPLSVSVPDGAPPARDANGVLIDVPDDAKDIHPSDDAKYAFIARHFDRLARCKQVIIATDNDEPGQRLAKEIVRRIGAERCWFIQYPTNPVVVDPKTGEIRPCKDLNEVHVHLGIDAVADILQNAKEWPIKGLFKYSDYPDTPQITTYETGLSKEFDEHFRPFAGAFVVVTGAPGMGKSTIVNQISVRMAQAHGWNIGIFSGEMPTRPVISDAIMSTYLHKPRKKWTADDRRRAEAFIEQHYCFIDNNYDDDAEDFTVDSLLDYADKAVARYGIKMLIIDPWNELEHNRDRHISLTEYVGNAIRKIKRFAKASGCAVFLVAHPRKLDKGESPGLYTVSDSANYANKADLALIVHSDDIFGTLRTITIPKVRFSVSGRKGEFEMDFDTELENFVPLKKAPF